MDKVKAIYISPNYDGYVELYDEMTAMTDAEKIAKVKELDCNEVVLMSLETLQFQFNEPMWISDEGYIFFVNV